MFAEPRASRKSFTTTSSSRKPTITVGASSSIGTSDAVQARRRCDCTSGCVGAYSSAARTVAPRRRIRSSNGDAHAGSRAALRARRFRKKSPVFARSAIACFAFAVPILRERLQARAAQLRGLAPRRPALLARQRRDLRHRAVVAHRRQRAERLEHERVSSPNGSLSCRMRASIGTTRGSLRPTSDAITAARASPVDAFSTVCSARSAAGSVDARERRHRGLQHAHVGPAQQRLQRRHRGAGADLAERPRELALHEPGLVVERRADRGNRRRRRA